MPNGLFGAAPVAIKPFRQQLLKWIGNKQRFAHQVASFFPSDYGTYYEPFLGSGAVLGTLGPHRAVASDVFQPPIEIWQTLREDPSALKRWYLERWERMAREGKVQAYERVRASYNANPNGADLLFLCRACYGGVVRLRKADGHMSTPCGAHQPIHPTEFAKRVGQWSWRTAGTRFRTADYREVMAEAGGGDLVYCDPPYAHSQGILYGAQEFDIRDLLDAIRQCKARSVRVALSIDGKKRSGRQVCNLPLPPDLFERELFVNCGASMLKRFQMGGEIL